MPYLLGLLGVIVTVLVLLSRLADAGIDLGGLNPFPWRRKRAWRQKFEANPLFSLEDPMEVAAVLAVGVTKVDGDMSAEQKRALLDAFQETFALERRPAEDLLASSAHLVGDGVTLKNQVGDVVARSKEGFTENQVTSTISLLEQIAAVEDITDQQRELIVTVEGILNETRAPSTWE